MIVHFMKSPHGLKYAVSEEIVEKLDNLQSKDKSNITNLCGIIIENAEIFPKLLFNITYFISMLLTNFSYKIGIIVSVVALIIGTILSLQPRLFTNVLSIKILDAYKLYIEGFFLFQISSIIISIIYKEILFSILFILIRLLSYMILGYMAKLPFVNSVFTQIIYYFKETNCNLIKHK